jgi:hypothetical protein
MRLSRSIAVVALFLIALAFPEATLADHCGGAATVEPASGSAGTTFVFRTNQGAATNIYLYRNGKLVRTDTIAGTGSVSYRIRTQAGDEGRWRVRAAVQGQEECHGDATFRVTAIPDTATADPASGGPTLPVVGLLAAGGFLLGWRRMRIHRRAR